MNFTELRDGATSEAPVPVAGRRLGLTMAQGEPGHGVSALAGRRSLGYGC